MTHALIFGSLFFLSMPCFATAESPVVQGLSGAGRAGNAREALFANPASVAFVTNTFAFFHYTKPRIPELNAGGRGYNLGVYDGGNADWKGGFGYIQEARAVLVNGQQSYVDRNEFRFSTAHMVTNTVVAGVQARYIGKRSGTRVTHFLDGDFGVVFPVFGELRGGVVAENLLNREDDHSFTIGGGLNYPLGYGIQLYGDGYQMMKGTRKNYKGYALAGELQVGGDFTLRAGRFQEAFRKMKGWSLGLSWSGPRASFDYAMKFAGNGPKERTHIFGLTVVF